MLRTLPKHHTRNPGGQVIKCQTLFGYNPSPSSCTPQESRSSCWSYASNLKYTRNMEAHLSVVCPSFWGIQIGSNSSSLQMSEQRNILPHLCACRKPQAWLLYVPPLPSKCPCRSQNRQKTLKVCLDSPAEHPTDIYSVTCCCCCHRRQESFFPVGTRPTHHA